ncbi:DNA-binding HTH domain-containing protein, LuxR-type [Desulfonema limicola]|uniref:DNA-binding HTH domain-containing protein, LuxR-type n=1 Tax=Desulfonema limicola TaxID=45656 RepID=A0A975GID9_9BACT|nr:helix-turn-helix transcriptional regulator [Desulfonema limicola]QTA82244.1 DNA-binding HTH domain-containing protein, LuxR-type [Desulfonema limicola]
MRKESPETETIYSEDELRKKIEHDHRTKLNKILQESQKRLVEQSVEIHTLKTTIDVLMQNNNADKQVIEENILSSLSKLICPYFQKLKQTDLNEKQAELINVLESNLKCLTSSFACKLSSPSFKLTPTEIQIASLVKAGKTSKEISNITGTALNTVTSHRHHIRHKLGLKNKKVRIKVFLSSLEN